MSIENLKYLYQINLFALQKNLEGITHAESLIQPQPSGNCLNWVLGHILATREVIYDLLKEPALWSKEEVAKYERGSAPVGEKDDVLSLEKMVSDLAISQERLMAGLSRLSEADLNVGIEDQRIPAKTTGEKLLLLQFHEAYHTGQIGLLRRIIGKEGVIK